MRHEAIEMVCAHILQGQEPPPDRQGVFGASAQRQTWEILEGTTATIQVII